MEQDLFLNSLHIHLKTDINAPPLAHIVSLSPTVNTWALAPNENHAIFPFRSFSIKSLMEKTAAIEQQKVYSVKEGFHTQKKSAPRRFLL